MFLVIPIKTEGGKGAPEIWGMVTQHLTEDDAVDTAVAFAITYGEESADTVRSELESDWHYADIDGNFSVVIEQV